VYLSRTGRSLSRVHGESRLVFQKVSEHVFAVVGRPALANVSAFVLPEKVVLVDCGLQLSAVKEARSEIEEVSGRKVAVVILTHFHSDHTHALPAFSDCRIISSNLLVRNLKQAGRKVPVGFSPTFPTETFDRQLQLTDDGVKLVVKQTGGHTDCSTYVFCQKYRTIAAGDNLWTEYYPWGGARGGDPDVWAQALEEYLSLDAEWIIPGHGPIGKRDDVKRLLDYINAVGNAIKEKIAQGKGEVEAIRAGRDIRYPPSRGGCAHISTLRKWYAIWRTRAE
jgi:cyclase